MAQIIDFPTERIKRLIVLESMPLTANEKHSVDHYFCDLRKWGFSAREAAKEALEAAQCR